jgi:hypothetical protein
MEITGIYKKDEAAKRIEFAAMMEEKFPKSRYSWDIEGPYYDRSPEKKIEQVFHLQMKKYPSGNCTLLVEGDEERNFLDDGYDEYPYRKSPEAVISQAKEIYGDKFFPEKMTFTGEITVGGEEIDGTGIFKVYPIDNHAPAGGGRFGGGWD